MRVSSGFRAYALEQLGDVAGLRDRAMFGGVGLYAGEVFFGLIAADVLCLRVNETNRAVCQSAGATPFKPYPDHAMTMPYYAVPASVLEDRARLAEWARQSIALALKARTVRESRLPPKARKKTTLSRPGKK